MSSEKPLLVVLGATGTQGGSVVSYFLSLASSPYAIRGVTRDPSSPKAVALTSLGVEMVAADFDIPSSLEAAFKGASVIFSVTDYWLSFVNPSLREKAAASGQNIGILSREHEKQQNKNIIDAASKVNTLERFIFSSMANASELSGGKYTHVYHFDGKAAAEEYGRLAHPELWEKTSVLFAGYYLENYFRPAGGLLLPKLNKAKDTLTLSIGEPLASSSLPMYSAIADTGSIVHSLLRTTPGKKLIGVNQWLNCREFATLLAQHLGKRLEFIDHTPNFEMSDPIMEEDHLDMMGFCIEFGYYGEKVDNSVVQPADLGVEVKLESVKQWCAKQDWEKYLQID